jgi:pimeloyl-ACP methyl ester carboxylesterase
MKQLTYLFLVSAALTASCGSNDETVFAQRSGVAGDIADISVSFTVENLNRSLVLCLTDGATYTLSGHIVGPASALRDGAAATLYLHGAAVPEATWRMPVRGYDYGYEQARRGHISVTLDRLSYGASPTPNGLMTCHGGQADMAHQIVTQLRDGSYLSPAPIGFSRIALAGHSAGQVIAEIAAYSFGDIDALVIGGWGDPFATLDDAVVLLPTIQTCATGGEPKRPGEPSGYAFTFEGRVPELLFHNAEEAVIGEYVARHERDACDASLATAPPINALMVSQIEVPVFLFYGLNDALWPAGTGERQRGFFTGSNDVTLFELPDTGHMIMLERTAPTLRVAMSDWLHERGF